MRPPAILAAAVMFFVFSFAAGTEAQLTTTLGSLTGVNHFPFNFAENGRGQTAYTATELGIAQGALITEVRVFGSVVAAPSFTNLRCRLGFTNLPVNSLGTGFDSNFITPPTTCLHGNITPTIIPDTGGNWYCFVLTTPFQHDGISTLIVDWSYDARVGLGFRIGDSPPSGEQPRCRVLQQQQGGAAVTGSVNANMGNYGIRIVYQPPGNGVYLGNRTGHAILSGTGTDVVMFDVMAHAFGQAQSLNAITFEKTGSAPDAAFSAIKLVRDNNDNGVVDPADTVIGQGPLTSGLVTFSGAPLQALAANTPVRLLLAASYAGLAAPHTLGFRVMPTAVVWSGGTDLTTYPLTMTLRKARFNGLVSVAAGNPGGAFDFADLGDVFNDLEEVGMEGPVIVELHDDGGPFISTASYQLGGNGIDVKPIAGSSASNPIVIRAAAGKRPVVQGSGAASRLQPAATGTMVIWGISNLTIEGLTITGGQVFGIMDYSDTLAAGSNVTIRRCRIHGITQGAAIFSRGNFGFTSNVLIENNMIWDCVGDGGAFHEGAIRGVVGAHNNGANWVIRHNTILHNAGSVISSVFFKSGNNTPFQALEYNVIHLHSGSAIPCLRHDAIATLPPVNADRNVVFLGGVTVMTNIAGLGTWAQWQAAGKDINGINADPLLVNIATGQQDLHLQINSPAIGLAVGSTVVVDIDGESRPNGAAPDAGADELWLGQPPAMVLRLNGQPVTHGAGANVGNVAPTGVSLTFTIANLGPGDLWLVGTPLVQLTAGANCGPGTAVTAQPTLTFITASNSTTFTVLAQPATAGAFNFTLSIANSDLLRNPYMVTVSGNGVANAAATAAPTAASSFTGPTGGPFTMTIAPGAALVNAEISLTDAEFDAITVLSIAPPSPFPTGVVTPPLPTPGHPLVLAWAGTAGAANPPGTYTWVVNFVDAGSSTPGVFSASIVIADLPPYHLPIAGQAGTGTASDPYVGELTANLDGMFMLPLADVADPNAQIVTITSQTHIGGTAQVGVGFQFYLIGGELRAVPGGVLDHWDVGTQHFRLDFTDGLYTVTAYVHLTVNEPPQISIPFPQPKATVGVPYTLNVGLSGGTGALTLFALPTDLPPGLSVTPPNQITGVPTTAGYVNFRLRLGDSLGVVTIYYGNLEILDAPKSPDDDDESGCAARSAGLPLLLLLPLLARLRRRQYANHLR